MTRRPPPRARLPDMGGDDDEEVMSHAVGWVPPRHHRDRRLGIAKAVSSARTLSLSGESAAVHSEVLMHPACSETTWRILSTRGTRRWSLVETQLGTLKRRRKHLQH
jgi:hypothetical protein